MDTNNNNNRNISKAPAAARNTANHNAVRPTTAVTGVGSTARPAQNPSANATANGGAARNNANTASIARTQSNPARRPQTQANQAAQTAGGVRSVAPQRANNAGQAAPRKPLTLEQKKRILEERKRKAEVWQMGEFMGLVLCGIMVLILVVVGFIAIVAPKSEYSSLEKRELAKMPPLTMQGVADGSFSKGVDLFFADNFPWREGFISQSKKLRRLFGVRPEGKTIYDGGESFENDSQNLGLSTNADEIDALINSIKGDSNPGDTNSADAPENGDAATPGTEDLPPVQTDGNAVNDTGDKTEVKGERRGALYVMGDTAIEIFKGKKEHVEYYAEVVNLHAETYKKYIPDINVYCMVFPTHTEFALPTADRALSHEQRPVIDDLAAALSENVTFVDPYDEIKAAFDRGEYVYFRTDHHWTARGAYYAFAEYARAAGLDFKALGNYTSGKIEKFLGSFYASTTDPALRENPDYVEYFDIDTPYKATYYKRNKTVYSEDETLLYRKISDINNGYLCFTGGDQPYIRIVTENKNGRKLLIFKESYGNPLVTFLTDCYEEIHVADIRSFPYNSAVFAVENGITDVLFANSAMSASTSERIKDIEKLLTKS